MDLVTSKAKNTKKSPHDRSGVTGHKMNIVHPGAFTSQSRLEGKDGLLPFRIQLHVLNEQEGFQPSMCQLDGDLIPFR